MKLLFVTWDGPGTTYHETLFIPLLARATGDGDRFQFLQFSWGAPDRVERLHQIAADHGAELRHLDVPRGWRILLLPFTLISGLRAILRNAKAGRVDTIMARSMIPGGLAVVAMALARGRLRFIYDADGLSADERVEFGGWPQGGLRYRIFRRLERASIRRAAVTLVRTQRAVDILTERAGISPERFVVVANGKDADVFNVGDESSRLGTREALGVPAAAPLLVHVGSAGPQYEPGFTMDVFRAVHRDHPDARLLLLTATISHDRFRAMAADLPDDALAIQQAAPDDVPALLAAADVGLAFRTPTLSQQAVAPIKVAEYLLCGLPVAYSCGVGDLDEQLHPPVGFAVDGATPDDARKVADWVSGQVLAERDELRTTARALGVERFSLDVGAAAYRRAFNRAESGS